MPRHPVEHNQDTTSWERFRSLVGLILFAVLLVVAPVLLVKGAAQIRQLAVALESPPEGSGVVPTLDTPRIEPPGVAIGEWNVPITAAGSETDANDRETSPTVRTATRSR